MGASVLLGFSGRLNAAQVLKGDNACGDSGVVIVRFFRTEITL